MKTQKNFEIGQRWMRSVRGRPWPGNNTTGPSLLPAGTSLWRRAPFLMLVLRADHSRNVCACWRGVFFCVDARTRLRRANATGHFSACLGDTALFHFNSKSKFSKVQSSNLLLPDRFGLPPTARSLSSGFVDENYRASLIPAVMGKRTVQSRGSLATKVDRVPQALCKRGFIKTCACCSPRGGASAVRPILTRKTSLGSVSLAARRCAACFDILDPQLCCQRHDPRANAK